MKLAQIFRFELDYQLRRIWTWLVPIAVCIFCFVMTRDGALAEALHADFFVNSPFSIAKTTVSGSLIWLLVAAFIAGEAAARDVTTGMHPLAWTAPVSKGEYLGGRFLAAFVLNALVLLAVQASMLLAVYSPGIDPLLLGPFRPAAYLTAYLFLALPNAFFATAIQFSLATGSGRPMAAYLGSLFLFFMSFIVGLFLLSQGRGELANLLDPVGVNFILSELSHLWTTYEKSWRLLELEGTALINRLIWVATGIAALALTYVRFRFEHRTESTWWARLTRFRQDAHAPLVDGVSVSTTDSAEMRTRGMECGSLLPLSAARLAARGAGEAVTSSRERAAADARSSRASGGKPPDRKRRQASALQTSTCLPEVTATTSVARGARTCSLALHARQTLAIASTSFRVIAKSWAGLAMLIAIPLMTILVVIDQMSLNGVPFIPATARVLSELTAPLSTELSRWVIVPLLIVFFAGELVWRERDAGVSEITDAMPGSEWPPLLGKFLGLAGVLTIFIALLMAAAVIAQAILGYHHFEIGLYLKVLFGLQLPEYLLFAVLALAVHVLVDQKYIGHLVAIAAYVFILIASMFGVEHDLLIYGAGPAWTYTEMSGFGASLAPWLWFRLYWAAWALLVAVIARLLWMRGRESALHARLRLARRRVTRPTLMTAAASIALILTLGGFIFYNTNVLNEYVSSDEAAERSAEYERRYGRYGGVPQPRISGSRLQVEIYPKRRQVGIRGTYRLVNRSAAAIDNIHIATMRAVDTGAVTFDRSAKLVAADHEHGHRIYALDTPLQPDESLQLSFTIRFKPRGFRETGADPSVVENGTFFMSRHWLPAIGYQRNREITSAAGRRAHKLPPRPLIPSLYDAKARRDRDELMTFEAVVGTAAGQTAVAPGVLRRTWTSNGRRYFHYASDAPVGSDHFFFSADYRLHEARWKDPAGSGQEVAIRIFHHPRHTANLERMVRGVRASLDYYTKHFGPYRYSYIQIVEHAGDGDGAGIHALTAMLVWEEGFAFWNPKDRHALDLPFAVMAHEMGHQWTVPYAHVEGAPVMSESLAWYYAMQVVENASGKEQLRRLLHFMRQPHPYPPIRRGEPLLRGLDPYMSYRKGPFVLYALSEYIGKGRVNAALRRLLETHRPPDAPLATTLDLYRELKAVTPPAMQYLLHDFFEVNTWWEFEAERATAKQTAQGSWQVTLEVDTRKVVFDEKGVESVKPMNELVEIGIFGAAAEDQSELSAPLHLQKHRIRSGKQTITVTVPQKPILAGIDPHHLLDWVEGEDDDNIRQVEIK